MDEFYQLPLIDKVTWYLRDLSNRFEKEAQGKIYDEHWAAKCMFVAGELTAVADFLEEAYGGNREAN